MPERRAVAANEHGVPAVEQRGARAGGERERARGDGRRAVVCREREDLAK